MAEETKKSTPSFVRVYNRGQRQFHHGPHRIAGAAFAEVPAEVAKTWMQLFPEDVVEAGVALKEQSGLATKLAETEAELAKARARIAELEALLPKKPADPKGKAAADQV